MKKLCLYAIAIMLSTHELYGDAQEIKAAEPKSEQSKQDDVQVQGKKDTVVPDGAEEGPDTLSLSEDDIGYQGNWIKKKEWIREAEDIVDNLIAVAPHITEYRESFYQAKERDSENILEAFYIKGHVARGKEEALFEQFEKDIAQKREKLTAALKEKNTTVVLDDVAVSEINEQLQPLKTEFENVKIHLKSIADLETALEERIKQVDEKITKMIGMILEGKKLVAQMYYILDDKKIRDKVFKLKEIYAEAQAIEKYLKNDLSSDYEKMITVLTDEIKKTEEALEELKKKDDDLKSQIDKLVSKPIHQMSKELQEKSVVAEDQSSTETAEEDIPKKAVAKKAQKSFLYSFYDDMIVGVEWIGEQVQSWVGWLWGRKPVPAKDKSL